MKAAIFASAFHPSLGGVEELCRQLAHQLRRTGHGASVYTNRWPKDLPAHETYDGLEVNRFPFRVPERSWRQFGGALLLGPAAHRRVRAKLRTDAVDVIHVQCVSSNAYYAVRASKRLGLPLVVTLQGELTMDANQLFQRSEFARTLLRTVMDQADVVTACSAKTLVDAEEFLQVSYSHKSRVIFNAARVDDFRDASPYQHSRAYLFALGRLVPEKGFDVLMRAFAAGVPEELHLLIAGDGPEFANLQNLAGSLGIADRVSLLGRADRAKTASLMKGCLFFVLPSRADEGLPVVCAEAMAAGKAVVATRSGGTPEAILNDQNGIVVEKGDELALVSALRALTSDAARRDRFAACSAFRAEQFSWPVVTEQYVEAYETAIGSARVPLHS